MDKEYNTLSNGVEIPVHGFGTMSVRGDTVKSAIKAGYRLIDTAQTYNNEAEVGIAIRDCIVENIVKREELFIVVKLHPNLQQNYQEIFAAFETSLGKLNITYADALLIHRPKIDRARKYDDMYWKDVLKTYWQAFERLYHEGKTRSIGVSNFTPYHIKQLTGQIDPMLNQIEFHPGWQQEEVLEYCTEKNIAILSWSVLMDRVC